jgi:DNA-binding Lrp family transcriptional regulator
MPTGFVLINSDLGKEEDLGRELKRIENVKEVHFAYGVYDFIVKVEAETTEKVKETITWKIRRLENVRSTLTMMVVD